MTETFDKTFSFAEFEIDAARRRLLKNGRTIALNPKAFDLLLTLVENSGAVLSKNELLDKVWADQFVEENNLTVHISALRKALGEKKNEHRFIITVPGKGYNFVAKVQSNSFEEIEAARSGEKPPVEISHFEDASDTNQSFASANGRNNLLPASPDIFNERESLVGREREVAEIKNLLRGDETNLITLTGAGGSGKTRLARAVAGEVAADFPDGVFFVELAAATETNLVVSAIAQALGVTEAGSQSPFETLGEFLRTRKILLILDNFEQILAAAPIVGDLLAASDSLKILVTSRAALHLQNEREFKVLPLDLPPTDARFALENADEYPAVALFRRRAQAAKPNFVLTDENAVPIAEICRRLDGLPLAIELAAVRVRLLSPDAILERLVNSLNLLTGGAKDLPVRQRTMRGAIEWSYELLGAEEKSFFRLLAVFVGGFTVEAAEVLTLNSSIYVKKNAKDERRKTPDVFNLLDSLIDNNLLVSKEQTDGNVRLRMLEVVREFALELLENDGEFNDLRQMHARYFLDFAEEADQFLHGETSVFWLEKLVIEHDNFRAALSWSLENELETAAQVAAALGSFWINHSYLSEGLRWCETVLQKTENSFSEARLKLLEVSGFIYRNRGDLEAARKTYEKGLTESQKLNKSLRICSNYQGLGAVAVLEKDYESAQIFYQQGLDLSRRTNEETATSYLLNSLVDLEMCRGNWSAARPLLEESLTHSKKLDNKRMLMTVYYNRGAIDYHENQYQAAASGFAESLRLAGEMGNKPFVSYSLDGFAALAAKNGNFEQSAKLSGAAQGLRESIGYKIEPAEEIFRAEYLTKVRAALGEKTFTAAFEQGQLLNLNEAVALARRQPENGSNGNRTNRAFSEFDEQSEIIIENHSFSRVIIEEEIVPDEIPYKTIESETLKLKAAGNASGFTPKIIYLSVGVALLAGLLAFWFWKSGGSANGNQFNLSKLTTSGKVTNATITPDGKYAVFSQTEPDGESLWLRHIATGSQQQILPAKPVRFVGLAMSPDGDTIYATIFSPALADPQIWRVPLLGSVTEEIKGITTGAAVSFSPDGNRIAFVESRSAINENHLLVADANGANKKLLLKTQGDTRSLANFNANPVAWSPEGFEIACALDEKNSNGATKTGILLVNTANGSERFVSEKRWDNVEHLTWTDAENLAFVAHTGEPWQGQIWTISKRTGEAKQITNDLNSYSWLASADGNLLTVQNNHVSRVSIGDFDEKTNRIEMREIFKESGSIDNAAWAAGGAVIFSSSQSGKSEIWRVNADGSNPTQLTAGANVAFGFAVSPVDGSIVFCSVDDGRYSLNLVNAEGKNIRRLTEGTEDLYPNFTPDGQTVIFQRGFENKLVTLWRVSLSDKNQAQITRTHGTHPAVSPDGSQTAHYFMDTEVDNLWRIRLVSTNDGTYLGKLSFPKAVTERQMRWHPNGKYIGQIFYEGEKIKLLLLPTDGGESQVVSGLGEGDVNRFDWSSDGRQIVVSHTTETQDVIFLSK